MGSAWHPWKFENIILRNLKLPLKLASPEFPSEISGTPPPIFVERSQGASGFPDRPTGVSKMHSLYNINREHERPSTGTSGGEIYIRSEEITNAFEP
jgi:hypothetical protein